jgi:hypothetical protein
VKEHAGFTIGHPSASWVDPAALLREFRSTRDVGNFIRLKMRRPYVEAENRLSIAEVLACCGSEGIRGWESEPCFMGATRVAAKRTCSMWSSERNGWQAASTSRSGSTEDGMSWTG